MNDNLILEVTAGIHAGVAEAIKRARRFGTRLVVSSDGKIMEITADEAETMFKKAKPRKTRNDQCRS